MKLGRVGIEGFLSRGPYFSQKRDTLSSTISLPPEEVLFRRKRAPPRYEENDIYWADQRLRSNQSLPDSDLLKAIHVYASDFYGRATLQKGIGDFRSMDETALLAMGILLEEAAKEILGESGDLVFVEGEEVCQPKADEPPSPMTKSNYSIETRSRKRRRLMP